MGICGNGGGLRSKCPFLAECGTAQRPIALASWMAVYTGIRGIRSGRIKDRALG